MSTKELCLSRCRKSRPGPFRHPQDSGCFPSESSYLIKSQVPESPSAWLAPQLSLPHFLWPSSARPILFAAPPYSETLCLPGPGDWSRWEQELHGGLRSFPGSPCGMEGNVSSGRPGPHLDSNFQPLAGTGLECGLLACAWGLICAFLVTMFISPSSHEYAMKVSGYEEV